ncbi:tetratricopeptide repeat protein [Agarilytica rhodophyticola]|uniref:tetratricopeptide repeat protein n=1 Tax=Agarilytica rhodophyticola TaxID=1737490 RepID=UPI001319FF48|nr:tetratricopeptide repeat protein [Agarilytica rhodophyticola]
MRYIKGRFVDFSCFDVENDKQITLELSGHKLGDSKCCNPIMATANYLFDSLRHDIFKVEHGEIYAALTQLSTSEDNIKVDSSEGVKVHQLDKIKVDFSYKKITNHYYDNKEFNDLLSSYSTQLKDEHFIFPIGGLHCLENLKTISNGRYFTIAADKGNCEIHEIAYSRAPSFSLHGNCFSMQVNFHALTHYSAMSDGDYIIQKAQTGLSSVVMLSGLEFSDFVETRHAIDNYLHRYSPATLFKLYAYIRDSIEVCTPDTFLALMNLTDWDSHIFNKYIEVLLEKLPSCSLNTIHAIHEGIPKITENFYHMPGTIDTFVGIVLFYQELGEYEEALAYYDLSIEYYGNADHISYNQGLCYYYSDNYQLAYEKFEQALALNPNFEYASYWRDKLLDRFKLAEDNTSTAI